MNKLIKCIFSTLRRKKKFFVLHKYKMFNWHFGEDNKNCMHKCRREARYVGWTYFPFSSFGKNYIIFSYIKSLIFDSSNSIRLIRHVTSSFAGFEFYKSQCKNIFKSQSQNFKLKLIFFNKIFYFNQPDSTLNIYTIRFISILKHNRFSQSNYVK